MLSKKVSFCIKYVTVLSRAFTILGNNQINMKDLFLCLFWGTFYSFNVFSQKNAKALTDVAQISKDSSGPDLNKYVYSHGILLGKKKTKPPLDFEVLDNWRSLDKYLSISRNGKYFAYGIQKGTNFGKHLDSIVIQATDSSWRQVFSKINSGFFSGDSKHYVFLDKSKLKFLRNGTDECDYIENVSSYKVCPDRNVNWLAYLVNGEDLVLRNLMTGDERVFGNISSYDFDKSGQWLVVRLKGQLKELLLYNLHLGKEFRLKAVTDFLLHSEGKSIVFKTAEKVGDSIITSLQYINLSGELIETIWSTSDTVLKVNNYCLDVSGKRVAFMITASSKVASSDHSRWIFALRPENSIWYWQEGMGEAEMKVNNETIAIASSMYIEGGLSFVDNSSVYLQFNVQEKPNHLHPNSEGVQIDIWSYKDTILQSAQSKKFKRPEGFKMILNLTSGLVLQLENEYERLKCLKGDYAVVAKSGKELNGDRFWEKNYYTDDNWLVSLQNGFRKPLVSTSIKSQFYFSPSGNYLVYYDIEQQGNYFSYNLSSGRLVNISRGLPNWQLGYNSNDRGNIRTPKQAAGLAQWLEGDTTLLVYDNFDIWQLDLTGKKVPLNVTNGYGYKNKVILSLLNSSQVGISLSNISSFLGKDTLLIRAFNRKNKFSGFYLKKLGETGNPEMLFMGPCFFSKLPSIDGLDDGMIPIKALESNIWIVKKQTATDAPNYYVTEDFKHYKQLTNLQPHHGHNWLTTELHSFKQKDGTIGYGVLYKPENFDANEKYPVIVSFYGHLSDRLYQYPQAGYIEAPSIFDDPSWMVSHGYLVFTPDIYFTENQWGPSTVNSIEGAAIYLKKLNFIDGKHIGAVGHSNSGRFGYYLLTHSKSFAAMSLGSGFTGTDVISLALSLNYPDNKTSNLEVAERNAYGAALGNIWQNKNSWIDHTAVLQVDKAISPLLLFHSKNDGDDPRAAVELYIAMRRLEKACWWLQYDKGDHVLGTSQDLKDFTIRYTQFFDHYLKEAPAPKWMTRGIPARLKGIETGYTLDPLGICGVKCVSCRVQKRAQLSFLNRHKRSSN